MIRLEEKYLKQVKNILAKHFKSEDAKVYVFGSRITDNFKKYSDLDLALDAEGNKMNSGLINVIKTDFENSLIPIKVDIVDLNDISEEFKKIILSNFEKLEI